jgi:hypothetical protein
MGATKTQTQSAVRSGSSRQKDAKDNVRGKKDKPAEATAPKLVVVDDYLPPLGLVLTVLACSGLLWVFGLRDVLATGRNIAGPWDEAMLVSCQPCLPIGRGQA